MERHTPSGGTELHTHAAEVLGILKRAQETGDGAVGEPRLAEETGLEMRQLNSLLVRLQQDGRVSRTAGGSWELTASGAATTNPKPDPREPS